MNKRNADFVMRYNKRSLYPLVDDKTHTKRLALEHGIAVPELYGLVSIQRQVRELGEVLATRDSFVIKPAQGAGGEGIMIVNGRSGDGWKKTNGSLVSLEALQQHAANVLSGMYSLGGVPDKAMIEYLVQFDPLFENVSYMGVPDIRVIVFRGVPVAAMVRLPTRLSDGKANLHQGAIGVGIDLRSGRTRTGVWQNSIVTAHPDTGVSTTGIQIPHWDRILELSARCADLVGLGYLGVDIVLDRDLGPLVLEFNARPGLNVQLATGRGLLLNLRKVEALASIPSSAEERAALSQTVLN
jgi:alpha-L-glutamate ligase-like protein